MNIRVRAIATLLMLPLVSAATAAGTTIARMNLAQLARAATVIVRARSVSSRSEWAGGAIWTVTEFEVHERFKGAPASSIRIRVPGGRIGHLVSTVEAAPRFRDGEDVLLFLEPTSGGDYSVTAWTEGTFRISHHPQTGLELISQDSSAYPAFDGATRQFRADGIRGILLSDFRQRLATALARAVSPKP